MNKYTCDSNKYSGGRCCVIDEKRKETGESFKEIIDQYYDESVVPDKMEQEINEAVASFENTEFKDRCMKEIAGRQKNIWRIGRICLSRAAAIAIIICLSTLSSVLVYAYVSGHIKSIKVNDYEDHGEVEFDLNEDMQALTEIEEYKDPVWIPDGYYRYSEFKEKCMNIIEYRSNEDDSLIYYYQILNLNLYLNY